jgi:hypothetical protein
MGTPGNVDAKTSGHKVLIELINRPGLPEKALVQAIRALGALEVGLQRLKILRYRARERRYRESKDQRERESYTI